MIVIKIQGALGNQLFQYALGRSLSIEYNSDLVLDLTSYLNPKFKNAFRLDKFNFKYKVIDSHNFQHIKDRDNIPLIFRLLKKIGIKIYPYYKSTHLYENEVLKLHNNKKILHRDYYLEGWFFNYSYFNRHRDIIIDEIHSNYFLPKDLHNVQTEINNTNSVAVHIRRGDFLTNTYFKLLPKEYYISAISTMRKYLDNPFFYFFSNDPEWVRKEFLNVENSRIISNNSIEDSAFSIKGDIDDLILISRCKHQIIANSSFSWWGAWLNEYPFKKVCYPAIYYNDPNAQALYEKSNNMPSEWIKINII